MEPTTPMASRRMIDVWSPAVLAGGLPLEVAGRPGEERSVVDGAWNVELGGQANRLAGLSALDLGELGAPARRGLAGERGNGVRPCAGRGTGPLGEARQRPRTAVSTSSGVASVTC